MNKLPSAGQMVTEPEHRETDPVVDAFKKDIDRTLLRQNLKRTVSERLANLVALQELAEEAKRAGRQAGQHRD